MRSALSKPLRQARTGFGSRLNLDERIQVVGEPLLYRLRTDALVVAAEETAQIATRDGSQRISFVAVVPMLFGR